jgi:hypothetical protein
MEARKHLEARKHFQDSDELCRHVAAVSGDSCLLSFSAGKDSIAAWLWLRRYFRQIQPFYLYLVPDLEFVEEGLRYFEAFFETTILRIPHPSIYRMLNNFTFQPPERCAVIERANLPMLTYQQAEEIARQHFGLPDAWVAIGTRTADSPIRLANVKRYGPLNYKRRSFLPVYDWRIDRLVGQLREAGVKLPIDYRLFGRSFDGIDYRFLAPIKQHLPADYQRILEWFPLAELELFRRGEL